MQAAKVNPILQFACFGVLVTYGAVASGQIAERRWTVKEVESLGISRTTQWDWRQSGKLRFISVGCRIYYTASQLKEAGLL